MFAYCKKVEETETFVIYEYGDYPDVMTGLFKYYKTPEYKIEMIKNCFTGGNEIGATAMHLCFYIKKFFLKNSYYPKEISYESG